MELSILLRDYFTHSYQLLRLFSFPARSNLLASRNQEMLYNCVCSKLLRCESLFFQEWTAVFSWSEIQIGLENLWRLWFRLAPSHTIILMTRYIIPAHFVLVHFCLQDIYQLLVRLVLLVPALCDVYGTWEYLSNRNCQKQAWFWQGLGFYRKFLNMWLNSRQRRHIFKESGYA